MAYEYPIPSFHFSVDFLEVKGAGSAPLDCRFSKVSGLGVKNTINKKLEAGTPYKRPFPEEGREYGNVTLERGVTAESDLIKWFNGAAYDDPIKPVPVLISLLSEKHKPILSWLLYEAYLESWTFGGFDAMQSNYLLETIVLSYSHYKEILNDDGSSLEELKNIANNSL